MALRLYEGTVVEDWVDELDHMNFLEYQRVADLATGRFFELLSGVPGSSWVPGSGFDAVVVETRVRYLRELRLGSPVTIDTMLAGVDERRFHLLHHVASKGRLACTVEVLLLAFDPASRRAGRWSEDELRMLRRYAASDSAPGDERVMPWITAPASPRD
jgi:acyl-CoA thioesterase FadM